MRHTLAILIAIFSFASVADNRARAITAQFTYHSNVSLTENFFMGRAKRTQAVLFQPEPVQLLAQGLRNSGQFIEAENLFRTFTMFGPLFVRIDEDSISFEPINRFTNRRPLHSRFWVLMPEFQTREVDIRDLCGCTNDSISAVFFGDQAVALLVSGLNHLADYQVAQSTQNLWQNRKDPSDPLLPAFLVISKSENDPVAEPPATDEYNPDGHYHNKIRLNEWDSVQALTSDGTETNPDTSGDTKASNDSHGDSNNVEEEGATDVDTEENSDTEQNTNDAPNDSAEIDPESGAEPTDSTDQGDSAGQNDSSDQSSDTEQNGETEQGGTGSDGASSGENTNTEQDNTNETTEGDAATEEENSTEENTESDDNAEPTAGDETVEEGNTGGTDIPEGEETGGTESGGENEEGSTEILNATPIRFEISGNLTYAEGTQWLQAEFEQLQPELNSQLQWQCHRDPSNDTSQDEALAESLLLPAPPQVFKELRFATGGGSGLGESSGGGGGGGGDDIGSPISVQQD